jgi:hypothetical protein
VVTAWLRTFLPFECGLPDGTKSRSDWIQKAQLRPRDDEHFREIGTAATCTFRTQWAPSTWATCSKLTSMLCVNPPDDGAVGHEKAVGATQLCLKLSCFSSPKFARAQDWRLCFLGSKFVYRLQYLFANIPNWYW